MTPRRAFLAGAVSLAAIPLVDMPVAAHAGAPPPVLPDPPPGKGQIVFYRDLAYGGAALTFMVREGKTDIGLLPVACWFLVTVDPGWHVYTVRSERHDDMRIEIEAGETYFVSCDLGVGFLLYQPSLTPRQEWSFDASVTHLHRTEPAPLPNPPP